MKKAFSAMLFFAMLGCVHSTVWAAELLDVKPVISGSSVSIEITADIPVTYTYYKVPGQARAVVDIAEADPEKVEPLIVVNKGAVSSISVDKAQISGIVVSRIIFNLVSETDISVSASPDHKLLTVTFGDASGAATTTTKPEPKPEPVPVKQPEPVAKTIEPPAATAAIPPVTAKKEEDPLGLDEPDTKTAAPAAKAAAAVPTPAAPPVPAASTAPIAAAPMVIRVPKLEPVVPVAVAPARPSTALTIKGIASGESYIDIRTNQTVAEYKTMVLPGPERLVIDILSDKISQKPKSFTVNKFGVTKARIGISPKYIRVVIDSDKTKFPAHTVTTTEDGLRITFK